MDWRTGQPPPPPPVFSYVGNNSQDQYQNRGIVSLVDVFDDFLFNPNEGPSYPPHSARVAYQNQLPPYYNHQYNNNSTNNNNSQYEENEDNYYEEGESGGHADDTDEESGNKPRKRTRGSIKDLNNEQKFERRERNREHAKKSRVRKKFLLESLQHSVRSLEEENAKLRSAIRENLKEEAEELIAMCGKGGSGIIASDPNLATRTLDNPDYSLVKALQTAEQTFLITDPALTDNPIVYASQGFINLTGYNMDEVLGRNCRFLQGPDTDPKCIARIRSAVSKGEDITEVILNYRKDGSTFWNQLFCAALADADGNVVNFLGVQCQVTESYAQSYLQSQNSSSSELK